MWFLYVHIVFVMHWKKFPTLNTSLTNQMNLCYIMRYMVFDEFHFLWNLFYKLVTIYDALSTHLHVSAHLAQYTANVNLLKCGLCVSAVGDLSNELVRHFLIECTQKGVRLKGCPNEPYFGEDTVNVFGGSCTVSRISFYSESFYIFEILYMLTFMLRYWWSRYRTFSRNS